MTSVTYAAAIIIQKTWRGYIFAKALPYALAQKDPERVGKNYSIKSKYMVLSGETLL